MSETLFNYVETTGVIVPDTATLLSDVESEWTGVLGAGLNTDSSTPQGIIIASDVAARSAVVNNNAALANQINPNEAGGVFLDAICALTGLSRESDTYTTVDNVVLAGVQGSPIAAGTQVKTPLVNGVGGDTFALASAVTLDTVTGQAVGTYVAMVSGAVPCPAGAFQIVTPVLGLETVTNPATATPGTLEQSDEALRALRRNTLALQGNSTMAAITSAIWDIPGVIGLQDLENVGAAQTISGVAMQSKSVWVCVDGGTPLAIATALLNSKSSGSNWNGAQSLTVIEPASGQSYTPQWDIPTLVPLLVQVTAKQGTFVGDINAAIIQAVLDFANNAIAPADPNAAPVAGFTVGASASPFEIAAGIMQECPGLWITNVALSLASGTPNYQPAQIAMLIYQKATVSSGDISVVLG